ncbi:MFS transporter [Burkholderia cenocepacia]|uniref:MFS transporter n=1 Tax=Burkholderia cenocepacia TaxID=95486 RepID=UPI000F68CEC0|nr:MFS transporter [Burkholderia cenocepacia]MBJ9697481.1 MFS transporter [Burkholderia cenocepacia]MBN3533984.1 MFS transporter [Burkholderia cenocepacia]MBO1853228.1 MFS transporter [Burkholderia cenocepacia]MBR8029666.1 MFS transporter [Burkholderia cenocepacia]MBR8173490.1 MFS transporter [Burkholderia cenocepacia]
MTPTTVNVVDVIGRSRLGALQYLVLGLCTLCLVIDGFDVQAIGYVAPAIIKQWGIARADLGQVFGAGLVGMTIGALLLGPVADRIGRRPVLIGAMLCLASCMYATAQASSVPQLLLLRFATGLSMGAIIPNAVALAGEFSPTRIRVTTMMIISSGFIVGGAIGGAIAAAMIPAFGWRSVFIVGAAAPLLVALVMIGGMPESPQFMAMQQRGRDRVRALLRRIDPALAIDTHVELVVPDKKTGGVPFMHLFRHALGTGTVLLWILNFMNLLASYFLANWLPVIMNGAGHTASQAVLAGMIFWVGGIAGNLLLGWLVDRYGFGPTLALTFVSSALAVAAIGQVAGSLATAFVAISIAGFCVLGGQTALNALAAVYYPTALRSTGMSWALGVGRLGSILGPVIGGELLRRNWPSSSLLLAAAMPCVAALIAVLAFWRTGYLPAPARTAESAPADAASRI